MSPVDGRDPHVAAAHRPPCGKPTHTAVTIWGIAPNDHASLAFCAVPVLPNCGRPMFAPTPVPELTTPFRMSTA